MVAPEIATLVTIVLIFFGVTAWQVGFKAAFLTYGILSGMIGVIFLIAVFWEWAL